jgi:glycosyltransferase involved in cell wall biosynthesis
MAAGTPAIVSDDTSLAEVVGDAGIRIPSNAATAAGDGMLALASDRDFRTALSAISVRHARRFTWDSLAERVLAVLAQSLR